MLNVKAVSIILIVQLSSVVSWSKLSKIQSKTHLLIGRYLFKNSILELKMLYCTIVQRTWMVILWKRKSFHSHCSLAAAHVHSTFNTNFKYLIKVKLFLDLNMIF